MGDQGANRTSGGMRYRKLRIAWSVGWVILASLLCLLWWRSLWTRDLLRKVDNRKIQTTIGSQSGIIYYAHFDTAIAYKGTGNPKSSYGWKFVSRETYENAKYRFSWKLLSSSHESVARKNRDALQIVVPYWFLVTIAVPIGAISWLLVRFSLRTLLIGMTLVATLLGAVVWATRK
jgi:hypothetical protein